MVADPCRLLRPLIGCSNGDFGGVITFNWTKISMHGNNAKIEYDILEMENQIDSLQTPIIR